MLGNCRKLIPITVQMMSQVCSESKNNQPHVDKLCLKNFEGSSEGGAARTVKHLFKNYKVFVTEYVRDNHSSRRKILMHLFSDLIVAGKLTGAKVPR
jgi:hypothetical protein